MVGTVLEQHKYPADIVMQVGEMVREAVDRALRQLTANGGAVPQPAQGYQQPARTKEELLAAPVADTTTVPTDQPINIAGMDPKFVADLQKEQAKPQEEIILPKEDGSGWKF